MVVRRGTAGMKLFSCSGATFQGFENGWVHDCYHPLPNQRGEGESGTGIITRWTEPEAAEERLAVTAIAVDEYAMVAGWHLKRDNDAIILESPGGTEQWSLLANDELILEERVSGKVFKIIQSDNQWVLR